MFIYKDENDSLLHDDHIDGHMESKKQIVKMYKYMEITNIKKLFEYYIL